MMTMSVEELLDWIMDLGGSYHMTYKRDYLFDFKEYDGGNVLLDDDRECRVHGMEGFTVKMQSGKIKVIKGLLVVRSGIRTANCVYTLDGQASNKEEIKGYEAVRRISDWVEDQDGLLYPRYVKGFIGWLASIKQRMLEPVKVKYIYFRYRKGIVGNKLLRLDDVTSEGVKFKVEQLEDHTVEVEPQGNVGHVASSPEVQTQDLMDYYSAMEKIYVHKSLTFNDTLACKFQQESPAEEVETESNVWDDGSNDVNPFGGGNPGFHNDHYDNPLLTKESELGPIIWDIGDEEEEYHFVNKYPSFQEEPIVLVEEESCPFYETDNEEEESMPVYDTNIE
ncbi:hypothetical protein Tco_1444969, partial [Tanacetum coccineum]